MQPEILVIDCPAPGGHDRVAVRRWGTPGASAVVCVHGLSRNATDFDELAMALGTAFDVVAIDMPGRGASPKLADPARYAQPAYAAIARHVIDTLALGPAHWVGTSMGGLLGMRIASEDGQQVRSLVLNDIGAELDGAELARLRDAAAENVNFEDIRSAERYFRLRYDAFGPLSDARWHHLARHGVWQRADGRLEPAFDHRAVDRAPLPPRVMLWDTWDRVRCPALILRGEQSRLIARETCERMVVGRPGSRWLEVPLAGHAPDLHGLDRIEPVVQFIHESERI